jgi:hypothetical protein
MDIPVYTKDPADELDYTKDFSAVLVDGEEITAATVTATKGLTVESTDFDATTVTGWLSGGTTGSTYEVLYTATTSGGRVFGRRTLIEIVEK